MEKLHKSWCLLLLTIVVSNAVKEARRNPDFRHTEIWRANAAAPRDVDRKNLWSTVKEKKKRVHHHRRDKPTTSSFIGATISDSSKHNYDSLGESFDN